jgi:hypothetical protein
LGMAMGNQISLSHSTLGDFTLIASQVSLLENLLDFEGSQNRVSWDPKLTPGRLLWIATTFLEPNSNHPLE